MVAPSLISSVEEQETSNLRVAGSNPASGVREIGSSPRLPRSHERKVTLSELQTVDCEEFVRGT